MIKLVEKILSFSAAFKSIFTSSVGFSPIPNSFRSSCAKDNKVVREQRLALNSPSYVLPYGASQREGNSKPQLVESLDVYTMTCV